MIDHASTFVADCPACGPVIGIVLPEGADDDATVRCRRCERDLGRWGALKRDAIRRSMGLLGLRPRERPGATA